MIPSERIAEYEAIAREVLNDLGVSDRCSVITGGEPTGHHAWYVHISCDEEIFTVSGREALPNPTAREIIKSKIRDEIQSRLTRFDS